MFVGKSNMRPSLSKNHSVDSSSSHTVFFRNYRLPPTILSYFQNVLFGKDGEVFIIMSAFFHFICHVIGMGSEEKMVRINARRVVALVESKESIRDWSFMKDERNPMCTFYVSSSKTSIPVLASVCRPQPAIAGLIDLLKKSRLDAFKFRGFEYIVNVHYGSFHELLCMARSAHQRCRAFLLPQMRGLNNVMV